MRGSWRGAPLLLLAALSPAAAAGCGRPSDVAADYDRVPVLFVHGSGHSAASWDGLIEFMRDDGYPAEYLSAPDLLPAGMSNARAAEEILEPASRALLEAVEAASRRESRPRAAPGRIDIVAHSMGAFSGRWFAARVAPERVRTFVSIAGANHGTEALADFPGPGNEEMVPAFASSVDASAVQVALNGMPAHRRDETPFGLGADDPSVQSVPPDEERRILYVTMRVEPDRWIRPVQSALLDGAGGVDLAGGGDARFTETAPGNFLYENDVGHDELLADETVMGFVSRVLAWSR